MAAKRAREEEERLRGLSPKEREDYKKSQTRLTGESVYLYLKLANVQLNVPSIISVGRQLFERDRNLGTLDEGLAEEDAVSVDISQYDRTGVEEEENEDDHVTFSDSD